MVPPLKMSFLVAVLLGAVTAEDALMNMRRMEHKHVAWRKCEHVGCRQVFDHGCAGDTDPGRGSTHEEGQALLTDNTCKGVFNSRDTTTGKYRIVLVHNGRDDACRLTAAECARRSRTPVEHSCNLDPGTAHLRTCTCVCRPGYSSMAGLSPTEINKLPGLPGLHPA
jgi:hypothetical protein